MSIALSVANSYLNEEYNEKIDEQIQQLLGGVIIDKDTVNKKIDYVINKIGLTSYYRCCFYGRVSTVKTEQRSSIINQHNVAESFEADYINNGYIVVEEQFERESATSAKKRKVFMSIVDRALHGEFDAIVVKAMNRMFRNVDDTIDIMRMLREKNIALIFYYDDLNSLNESDRNDIIDKANEAERYSNSLSVNVLQGKNRNIRNGKGRCPAYVFGYDKPVCFDSSVLIINEHEAGLVNELFERYTIKQHLLGDIVRDWRQRGIKSKLGNEISTVALKRMLTNSIYIGVLAVNRKKRQSLRDEWEYLDKNEWVYIDRPDLQIVDKELFNLTQQRIENDKFGSSHMLTKHKSKLFKSMIKCDCCGKNFKKFKNGDKALGVHGEYYCCSTRKQGTRNALVVNCDNKTTIRRDELFDVIGVYFREILSNREDIEQLIRKSVANILKNKVDDVDNSILIKEIDKATNRYERELDLYREGLSDDKNKLKSLKTTLDKLKADLSLKNKMQENKYDVDIVIKNLFSNIESVINNNWNIAREDDIDGELVNSLFDSVLALDDGTIVFNLKGSRELTSTFQYINRDGCLEKYISDNYPLLSDKQLKTLNNMNNTLKFISINECLDYNKINKEMNSIRDKDTKNRRRYRYCKRYISLGTKFIDSWNIIL